MKARGNDMGDRCWYCGGELIWQSDFEYSDVYPEGEGDRDISYLFQLRSRSTVFIKNGYRRRVNLHGRMGSQNCARGRLH